VLTLRVISGVKCVMPYAFNSNTLNVFPFQLTHVTCCALCYEKGVLGKKVGALVDLVLDLLGLRSVKKLREK
jgi:hypothetical protein